MIIVAGPTAVGKTAVAVDLARQFNTVIISADSRQCYKEMKIGVARPSDAELAAVPHYFVASHSIHEEVTAAGFAAYALQTLNELFLQHDVVIMTGGTGLYIKAFCEGLDSIPAIDSSIRQQIVQQYEKEGLLWLQQQVQQKDPVFFAGGENKNPHRLIRALEVIEGTGKSILTFRKGVKAVRDFNIIKTALHLPKEILHRNIHTRVDAMLKAGLTDEVKNLLPFRHLPALHTVGYTELFSLLDGEISLDKAVALIKTHTRQYAKRQLTWFRKDSGFKWFEPGENIKEHLSDALLKGTRW